MVTALIVQAASAAAIPTPSTVAAVGTTVAAVRSVSRSDAIRSVSRLPAVTTGTASLPPAILCEIPQVG
jgi:hypothetical protein